MVAHIGGTQLPKEAEALDTSPPTIRQSTCLEVMREYLNYVLCGVCVPSLPLLPFPEGWVGLEARGEPTKQKPCQAEVGGKVQKREVRTRPYIFH